MSLTEDLKGHLPVLRDALIAAATPAFRSLVDAHPGDSFYGYGFYIGPTLGYISITAFSEGGLNRVVQEYAAQSSGRSLEELHRELRWSPCDSPWHLHDDEQFASAVDEPRQAVSELLWEFDPDDPEAEVADAMVKDALVEALQHLDKAGAFGTGDARKAAFISVFMGDQDESVVEMGRKLNSPEAVQRFCDETEPTPDDAE